MPHLIGRAFGAALLPLALAATPAAAQSGDATRGRAVFQGQCGVCHSVAPGKAIIGPSLAGIVGRAAGKQAGFAYSPALAKAGFKWDKAKLDAWIAGPAKVVPGNRMPFAGLADGAKRAD
ncbi:MAG TPA: c-type cytochrome, partial [Novosphingobium sp.]|nr:c-type cytochrome [Novosphingobium sp.]